MENDFVGFRLAIKQFVVENAETRGFTFELPDGGIPGYQLRFLLQPEQPQTEPAWSNWFFLSEPNMEALAHVIGRQMHVEGHLASGMTPGASAQ